MLGFLYDRIITLSGTLINSLFREGGDPAAGFDWVLAFAGTTKPDKSVLVQSSWQLSPWLARQ